MPNRFARQVPVNDFKPQGLLPDGLMPVARPGGEYLEGVSQDAQRLAGKLGAIADDAAAAEGARAGKSAGLDQDYRPTGVLTIRGRAFDKAATETYQNNLDAQLRTDMQSVYEANKHSPAELAKAFDGLQKEYEGKHVFPEIMGDFRSTFSRLRLPFQNKALSDLETRAQDQSRATLLGNVTASQTNAVKIAALDPASPETAKAIEIEIGRIDKLYDEASAGGSPTISKEAAEKLKQANRNSIMSTAMLAQADALTTPEAVAQYRANLREKFGKGQVKFLDGEGYASVDSQLATLERAKRTGHSTAEAKLQKDVTDVVQRSAEGFKVDASAMTVLATSPGAASANGQKILALGEQKLKLSDALRGKSLAEGELIVRALRQTAQKDGRAPTEDEADLIRFGEKFLKDQRTAMSTDMLGLAERKRVVPAIAPLDLDGFFGSNDPAAPMALAAQIRDRTAQARAVGEQMERAPQFLRPDEITRMKDIVDKGGDKALALAGAIVRGADTDAPSVLRQIGGDAPLLAQAGNIISQGGSLQAARDAFEASRIRTETGKELPAVGAQIASKVQRQTFGNAFLMQGEDGSRIRMTADAIARSRISRAGVDPGGSDAETIYKRALQEAAGATFVNGVQYGGVADYKPGYWSSYKVPVPAGVRADAFRDVLGSLRDADLAGLSVKPVDANGNTYSARQISGAIPIAVRGGYRFALGDPNSEDPKYIRGADGRPFVLPWEQVSTALRPRLPGAFLGEQ